MNRIELLKTLTARGHTGLSRKPVAELRALLDANTGKDAEANEHFAAEQAAITTRTGKVWTDFFAADGTRLGGIRNDRLADVRAYLAGA